MVEDTAVVASIRGTGPAHDGGVASASIPSEVSAVSSVLYNVDFVSTIVLKKVRVRILSRPSHAG